ncbi:hypothetical protein SUGI_0240300 [Cryptomeria japonica]|uniref:NDR1/HIN1-like protein 12 n=1 Tax=Cryptomeria japonica TaxID=3369 RepID=UPI002408EB42|nr:NDR1/HIN1-like protein 12 [Cryptomeria japonica]GLJ14801.1 hypothetical protein SUGI_0240300 [Cryptomeria japonica]
MYNNCHYHHPRFLGIPLRFPEDKFRHRLCQGLSIFIVVVGFIILVIYLALHPQKPGFSLQDAIITQWTVTDDRMLTSSLQFTIISQNSNDKIGVHYDQISAYATYMAKQITSPSPLTPFYLGHNDATIIYPCFNESVSQLGPVVVDYLRDEWDRGILSVNLRIEGKIQWKVGPWTSGHYHLNVNCVTIVAFTNCSNDARLPLEEVKRCHVSV